VAGATAEAAFIVATYAVAVAGAFAAAAAFKRANPEWDESIEGLAGLGSRHPLLSAALVVILLSLVGVPPLLGFWGKFFAFRAAIATGWAWLALAGLLGSVVSFGYYGSVLRALYFEEPSEVPGEASRMSGEGSARYAVAVSAAIIASGGVAVLVGGARLVAALFAAR
jgi:NADH-quinone oxidoreductase subunit N